MPGSPHYSAAPAPEGGAVEDLREALIQADLKIRSLPGTDQSDVEFIREALATRSDDKPEGGAVMKACADFQEAIDDFEADVADAMAEESERADLWDREVTVNIDALKVVMRAALATREEAPAEAGEDEWSALWKLADAASAGSWGVEDPMDPCLTIVANPEAPVYDWKWVATCDWPDEDNQLVTAREVKANAAFIAAANPAAIKRLIAALRAQPPAREDAQPVACSACRECGCNFFAHPAPDALRVAVEALKMARDYIHDVTTGGLVSAGNVKAILQGHTVNLDMANADLAAIDQALAALQAEQKGGAA